MNFQPYRDNWAFLTLIYISSLIFAGAFRHRFRSFWFLFKRIFAGLSTGTLAGMILLYIFRLKWPSFPSSVFVISLPIALFLIFAFNFFILKSVGRIRKKIIIIGKGRLENVFYNSQYVEKKEVENIEELIKHKDIDEVIICEKISDEKNLNLLIYFLQKLKTSVLFAPGPYRELLTENFNGNNTSQYLATFLGKKSDVEEFLIRVMDITLSFIILILTAPLMILVSILIKLTSTGSVFYTQQRAGKDGKIFTLYKFRTMKADAEKISGLEPAVEKDPRVTKTGKWLRVTRLDELPQLINVLRGRMSLVGPRPENLYRVETHKVLQGVRLAVKPGITGLAQIRSYYDLHPKHKIKYDYLYIQKRSLLLNLYILAKTIPVVLSRKGW